MEVQTRNRLMRRELSVCAKRDTLLCASLSVQRGALLDGSHRLGEICECREQGLGKIDAAENLVLLRAKCRRKIHVELVYRNTPETPCKDLLI